MDEPKKEKLIRVGAVKARIDMSASTIYKMVRDGIFPTPIKISRRYSAWPESVIDKWIEQKSMTRQIEDDAKKTAKKFKGLLPHGGAAGDDLVQLFETLKSSQPLEEGEADDEATLKAAKEKVLKSLASEQSDAVRAIAMMEALRTLDISNDDLCGIFNSVARKHGPYQSDFDDHSVRFTGCSARVRIFDGVPEILLENGDSCGPVVVSGLDSLSQLSHSVNSLIVRHLSGH